MKPAGSKGKNQLPTCKGAPKQLTLQSPEMEAATDVDTKATQMVIADDEADLRAQKASREGELLFV